MKAKIHSRSAQNASARGDAFARRPKSSASPIKIAATIVAPSTANQKMIIQSAPNAPIRSSHPQPE